MLIRRTAAAWLAWSSVAASAALILSTALLVTRSGRPTGVFTFGGPSGEDAPVILGVGAGMLVFPIVGALIATRKPENAIGWLFCAAGIVLTFEQFAAAYGYHALDTNPGLVFTVADDGVGFDPAGTNSGTGLHGMAGRLAALDGELEVRAPPGQGTEVEGRLPIHHAKAST